MADRKGQLGKFKTVAAVKMPHVPKSGAGFLRHLDAVAGVAEVNRIDRLRFEVLQLHRVVVFITAAGEDHAFLRFDAHRLAVMLGDQSDDFAI